MGNKCPTAAGSFLVVQLLGLSGFTARAPGSVPGQGTETPLAVLCNPKQNKKNPGLLLMKHRKTPAVKNSTSKLDYRKQPKGPGLVTTGDGAEVRTWGTRGDTPQSMGYRASNVAVVRSLSRDPMSCSTPSVPVLHYLWEFAQTHVH